jgi:serine/threonine protein kinase
VQLHTILADRYQIQSQLSQKAGRQTFLALDVKFQNLVIIKILRFDADFQWDDLKLFEREAATLKNLDHPAIPKYLDYFEVEQADLRGFALVQTYIDAPSLETVIKQGRKFSETEVIELADRLLSILTYLHAQNPLVIHRDIKPSNILLANRSGNSAGDVYLVDFGSVQTAASKDGGTITIVGSYGYISLEQFGGQTTFASDLYSLGMTLIYLITGNHPTELQQINGQVNFTAEISSKFKKWLEKMTQPHLDKRFDSAKIAQTALNSEDGSYGDFSHLKPRYSQVRLYRDRDKIEMRWLDSIPSPPVTTGLFLAFMGIGTFVLILSFMPLLFFIFLLIFVIVIITKKNPAPKFIHHILTIDSQYIYRSKARSRHHKSTILSEHPRNQIEILTYNPGYVFDRYLNENGTEMSRGVVTVLPKLSLSCGDFEYDLGNKLSKAELWWLGQELSDFLNLELQVIYPTPQVPPEPREGGGGGC